MPLRYVPMLDLYPRSLWQVYDLLEQRYLGFSTRTLSERKAQRIADRLNREWRKSIDA